MELIIVYWLAESPKHFAALRKLMPGILQSADSNNCEAMRMGLCSPAQGIDPAPVEYSLTDYGRSVAVGRCASGVGAIWSAPLLKMRPPATD